MKKTKIMIEIAIAAALAVICSFIKIWEMPQGGTIALTMIPIILLSYRRGPWAGIAAGVIYSLISLLFAKTIYHPLSILLDYILASGVLGIAGFFPKTIPGILLGTTIANAGRFLSSFISGVVVFGEYAPEGQNVFLYSFLYQATYIFPELIIALVILVFLFIKAKVLFFPKDVQ